MPAITQTSLNAIGKVAVTKVTLDGTTDTLTYDPSKSQILVLENGTAGALTPVITGSTATSIEVAGIGSIALNTGYSVGSVAAGAAVAIVLSTIDKFLSGTISVTGGTGMTAYILDI